MAEIPKDYFTIKATAHISGIDEVTDAAAALVEKINEAKALAGELASLAEKLVVKIRRDEIEVNPSDFAQAIGDKAQGFQAIQ